MLAHVQTFDGARWIILNGDQLFRTNGIDEIIDVIDVCILTKGGVVPGEEGLKLLFVEAV